MPSSVHPITPRFPPTHPPILPDSLQTHTVHAGHTSTDEMCNLYMMTYSQLPVFIWCMDNSEWSEVGAVRCGAVRRGLQGPRAALLLCCCWTRLAPASAPAAAHACRFCCPSCLLLMQLGGPGGVPEQGVLLPETKLFQPPATVPVCAPCSLVSEDAQDLRHSLHHTSHHV